MQPDSPYQWIKALGSCQVGTVWSAVDVEGRSMTIAVLDGTSASDQRWRDAFEATANALAQPQVGGPRFLDADFDGAAPWVAYTVDGGPGAERVFLTLGLDYQLVPPDFSDPVAPPTIAPLTGGPKADATTSAASTEDAWATQPAQQVNLGSAAAVNPSTAGPPLPVSAPPAPVSVAPQPRSGPPQPTSGPPQPASAPPRPTSAPPQPVLGLPQSPAVGTIPPAGPSRYDPLSPVEEIVPAEPHLRRTGLWVWIAGLVLVILTGGAVFALTGRGGVGTSESTPTTSSIPSVAFSATPLNPVNPGLEPPKPGAWPAQWPKFTATDNVRTITDLGGLGFAVKVPQNWQCIPGGRAEGFAKYYCGDYPGDSPVAGGELIVRNCPNPCTAEQQATMRKAEEAWGVQWIRSGQFSVYGEMLLQPNGAQQANGAQRHGLVVVAYWRSGSEGAIDRQLVLRMTAPVNQAYQLRRIANYLRDTVIF